MCSDAALRPRWPKKKKKFPERKDKNEEKKLKKWTNAENMNKKSELTQTSGGYFFVAI